MTLLIAYVHYNACKKGLQTFLSKCPPTLFFRHKLPAQYIPFSMRLTKQRHISVLYSQSPCLFHNRLQSLRSLICFSFISFIRFTLISFPFSFFPHYSYELSHFLLNLSNKGRFYATGTVYTLFTIISQFKVSDTMLFFFSIV